MGKFLIISFLPLHLDGCVLCLKRTYNKQYAETHLINLDVLSDAAFVLKRTLTLCDLRTIRNIVKQFNKSIPQDFPLCITMIFLPVTKEVYSRFVISKQRAFSFREMLELYIPMVVTTDIEKKYQCSLSPGSVVFVIKCGSFAFNISAPVATSYKKDRK